MGSSFCCPSNQQTKYASAPTNQNGAAKSDSQNLSNNNHSNNNGNNNITIAHNQVLLAPKIPLQQHQNNPVNLISSPQPIMSVSQYSAHRNVYNNGGGVSEQGLENQVAQSMSQSVYSTGTQLSGTLDTKYSSLMPLDCQTYQFMDFPFIVSDAVIHWVKATKMLFIMRGPSGSGKSTIVNCIREKFPAAVICSSKQCEVSDLNKSVNSICNTQHPSGNPSPRDNWLQNQIYQAFEAGRSPIIIDESHIRCWEYKYSVDLATRFDYLVQVVMPKTPWRFDPDRLIEKCNVSVEPWQLETEVKQFESALPLYFGWFLSDADSDRILQFASDSLEMLINIQEVRIGLASACDLPEFVSKEDLLDHWILKSDRLHVTTKFCGYGTVADAETYLKSGVVQESLGQLFPVHVRGLLLTPRTMSGHVQLGGPRQIQLWAGDDQEEAGDGSGPMGAGGSSRPTSLSKKTGAAIARFTSGGNSSKSGNRRPFGCRAHITLMSSEGVKPVQSGLDQLQIIDCQLKQQQSKLIAQTPSGSLIDWGKARYYLEFYQPIVCQALFTGQY